MVSGSPLEGMRLNSGGATKMWSTEYIMEERLRQLIEAGAYEDLLAVTAEALLLFPTDAVVLAYRARALFTLRRYSEADQTLYSVRNCVSRSELMTRKQMYKALQEMDKTCRAILRIEKSYEVHKHVSAGFEKNWYNCSL